MICRHQLFSVARWGLALVVIGSLGCRPKISADLSPTDREIVDGSAHSQSASSDNDRQSGSGDDPVTDDVDSSENFPVRADPLKWTEKPWFNVQDNAIFSIGNIAVSSNGKRYAYSKVDRQTGNVSVVVDGEEVGVYDNILAHDTHDVHAEISGDKNIWFRFSGDAKRVAYVAESNGQQFVVLDGINGKSYEGIGYQTLAFSPSGSRVAYSGKRKGKWFCVVDGDESAPYDEVVRITFSPDGNRVAYFATRNGKSLVVVDGVEGTEYKGLRLFSLSFDSSGKRVGYVANDGEKDFAVVDGLEEKRYDAVGGLTFSHNGDRVVYGARDGEKWFVVYDGVEGKRYDNISLLTLSPNGDRLVYAASEGEKWFVVDDGVEARPYDGIGDTKTLRLGPDGDRLAYVARKGEKSFVVVDGVEGKPNDGVSQLTFSPDGDRVVYSAQQGKRWFVVDDGVEGKLYDRLSAIPFEFDPVAKRVVYVAQMGAIGSRESLVVVNGEEGPIYDVIVWGTLSCDDARTLRFVASRDDQFYQVEVPLTKDMPEEHARLLDDLQTGFANSRVSMSGKGQVQFKH